MMQTTTVSVPRMPRFCPPNAPGSLELPLISYRSRLLHSTRLENKSEPKSSALVSKSLTRRAVSIVAERTPHTALLSPG